MNSGYIDLLKNGVLEERCKKAKELFAECNLCPRECKVNRLNGETGFCKAGANVKVSTAVPHFGEEPPLSGKRGSGTIFFTHCNMRCLFCQNYQISQQGIGSEYTPVELADMMLGLQSKGCHNINLVSPTHFVPQILVALFIAAQKGLILVDTKYEFGTGENGTLVLIDEIHTPDSSRYWQLESYEARTAAGQEPEYFDKEFLRLWFKEHSDPYKDAVLPPAPPELVEEMSRRYIQMYEQITGEKFIPGELPVIPRIERNLKAYVTAK